MRLSGDKDDPGFAALSALSVEQRKGLRFFIDGEPVDLEKHLPLIADEEQGFIIAAVKASRHEGGINGLLVKDGVFFTDTLRGKVRIKVPAA